ERVETTAELDRRLADRGERAGRLLRQLDEIAVELGGLGLDAVAHFLPPAFVTRVSRGANGSEQGLDRTERIAFGQALEPAVAGQRLGRLARLGDGPGACLVIAGDIREASGETPAAPARAFLRADDPALQFDRFLPGQRGGESAVG